MSQQYIEWILRLRTAPAKVTRLIATEPLVGYIFIDGEEKPTPGCLNSVGWLTATHLLWVFHTQQPEPFNFEGRERLAIMVVPW